MTATHDVKTVTTITPAELKRLLDEQPSLDLIDVRTPAEYRTMHVSAARHLPLGTLDASALKDDHNSNSDRPLYIVCQSGVRSRKACEALLQAGVNAVNVEGGTPACEKVGIEVTRGKQVMSLERQVRIGAGALVAIGTLLGVLVSPWFLVVPGFVGCGLIFAGVTDFCGMGLVLAKMPWNK